MKYPLVLILLLHSIICVAQTDSIKPLAFSAYTELYYSYDFSHPSHHEKPSFIYNHKRHNEVNLNLGYAKINYNRHNIRGNLALMLGNYAQYNLSAEPTWAQFVYEANIGITLSSSKNLTLDVGVLPSHIGFESAVGADCWTLTRSILAENSPYFETGAKVSHISKNEKLNSSFYVLNGWQRIHKPDGVQTPSFGMQLNYKPNNKLTLNYSNFIGSDKPDSVKATRIYHNLYAMYESASKIDFIVGLDIGSDKYSSSAYGYWYAPIFITRYTLHPKNKIAFRLEYYGDERQIIISTNTLHGFQTLGTSINYDYMIRENILWRAEAKLYQSKDKIFENKHHNFSLTTALTLKL